MTTHKRASDRSTRDKMRLLCRPKVVRRALQVLFLAIVFDLYPPRSGVDFSWPAQAIMLVLVQASAILDVGFATVQTGGGAPPSAQS